MAIITTGGVAPIRNADVYPNLAGELRVIIHTDAGSVSFTLDELEHINKAVAAHFADVAEPIPDFPGDVLASLAEQESVDI